MIMSGPVNSPAVQWGIKRKPAADTATTPQIVVNISSSVAIVHYIGREQKEVEHVAAE